MRKGITFVGAFPETDAGFPTAIDGVIAATGTEQASPRGVRRPREHVMTLRPQGQYDFASGTSVSAAELTGVIALLMSAAHTHLKPAQVVEFLTAAAPSAPRPRRPPRWT